MRIAWEVQGSFDGSHDPCEETYETHPIPESQYEVVTGPELAVDELSACIDGTFTRGTPSDWPGLRAESFPPYEQCRAIEARGTIYQTTDGAIGYGRFSTVVTCIGDGVTMVELCTRHPWASVAPSCQRATVTCGVATPPSDGGVDASTDSGADATPDAMPCETSCPPGHYLAGSCGDGGTSCVPCTGGEAYDCGAGFYRTGSACDGSTTTDTQGCAPCTAGAAWDCLGEAPASYRSPTGAACEGTGTTDTQMCTACTVCGVSCIPRPGTPGGECTNTTDTDCVCG